MKIPSSQFPVVLSLDFAFTGYWLLATSFVRQVMNMDFFLFSTISFSGIYALGCCVFCLCDGSRRGQVLYRLHK